jgi:cellobiose phosphorylase
LLVNTWLKYQILTAGVWARTSYGQAGGAIRFGDTLQCAQTFLPLEAGRLREQIKLHAAHQWPDGRAYGMWHPLAEEGHPTRSAADLMWLPLSIAAYLKETLHWGLLSEDVFYAKSPDSPKRLSASIYEHGCKALDQSMTGLSPRGLPLCGGAECVKTAHQLYLALAEWSEMIHTAVKAEELPAKEREKASRYSVLAKKLKQNINKTMWDGAWYASGSNASGQIYGSASQREGRISLSAQTWSVLSGVAENKRRAQVQKAVEKNLFTAQGPLSVAPAYSRPDEAVGLNSRYAPGSYGNGGVKLASAASALDMEARLGRGDAAFALFEKLSPVLTAAKDARNYGLEPYVMPEFIDGPASVTPGAARESWDAPAAAAFYRSLTEGILGLTAEWDGLKIRPRLPAHWKSIKLKRTFRETVYIIHIQRDSTLSRGGQEIKVNGKKIAGDVLPVTPGLLVPVEVRVGSGIR